MKNVNLQNSTIFTTSAGAGLSQPALQRSGVRSRGLAGEGAAAASERLLPLGDPERHSGAEWRLQDDPPQVSQWAGERRAER